MRGMERSRPATTGSPTNRTRQEGPRSYVEHFPANGSKVRISSEGGTVPRWSRDGRELFYLGRQRLVAVSVTPGATFERGQARTLFESVPFAGTFEPSA